MRPIGDQQIMTARWRTCAMSAAARLRFSAEVVGQKPITHVLST